MAVPGSHAVATLSEWQLAQPCTSRLGGGMKERRGIGSGVWCGSVGGAVVVDGWNTE